MEGVHTEEDDRADTAVDGVTVVGVVAEPREATILVIRAKVAATNRATTGMATVVTKNSLVATDEAALSEDAVARPQKVPCVHSDR